VAKAVHNAHPRVKNGFRHLHNFGLTCQPKPIGWELNSTCLGLSVYHSAIFIEILATPAIWARGASVAVRLGWGYSTADDI